ncbi:MAG: ATP-binding protein [bacterium]
MLMKIDEPPVSQRDAKEHGDRSPSSFAQGGMKGIFNGGRGEFSAKKAPCPVIHLLLVDGDRQLDQAVWNLIEKEGCKVHLAARADDALNLIKKEPFDLLLVDTGSSNRSGVDFLGSLQGFGDGLPLILIAGEQQASPAIESWKARAWESLAKPVQPSELVQAIRRVIDRKAVVDERDWLRRKLEEMESQVEQRTSQLLENQRILEIMFNGLEVGITLVDRNFKIIKANRYVAQLFRKQPEELIGKKCYAVFGEDKDWKCLACPAENCLNTALPISIDRKIRTPGGDLLYLQHTTFPLLDEAQGVTGFIHFTEDITQHVKLENQLIQSEKFTALGRLASCISHDLRNPLTVIRNASYYLKRKVDQKEDKVVRYLDIIEREADQAERIVSDLLTFCHPQPLERREIGIPELVENLLATMPVPPHITVRKEISQDISPISADPDQLHRVFGNLAKNAFDAMLCEGQLTIRAREENDQVVIEFQDTGIGIPEKILPTLFEPFFTTKAKGIGLGLYICKSIIEQHQGTIKVKSQQGQGTSFYLFLPKKRGI